MKVHHRDGTTSTNVVYVLKQGIHSIHNSVFEALDKMQIIYESDTKVVYKTLR